MGKTRGVHETTPELRNRMVGMYEAGLGLKEIATAINCSVSFQSWLSKSLYIKPVVSNFSNVQWKDGWIVLIKREP